MNPNEILARQNVCLVDDDPAVIKSVGRLLASDGFGVQTFDEPRKFLAYAAEHPVPLVILDVWMGEISGLEVQAKLSRVSPLTRVIIITGRKDPAVEKTAAQFGASRFFTKPFDDEEFLQAVRTAFSVGA
jgi:two-component system response regulator FixJ